MCLLPSAERYHEACLQELLGTATVPGLPHAYADLIALGRKTVGHTSISGHLPKVSMNLSSDGRELVPATPAHPGHFILKPQSPLYAALPENEHATMRLARASGIATASCGLFSLGDGSPAYLVRRFDRAQGRKLRQEDFCQLAEKPPDRKEEGSAEQCCKLIRRFVSEPETALRELFLRLVFAFLCGNCDLHLKNLSVLVVGGQVTLAPAYDLVCTELVLPGGRLTLPIGGKHGGLTRRTFLNFAHYCGIPKEEAGATLDRLAALPDQAGDLIDRSWLPPDRQERYRALLGERARVISPRP